MSNAYEIYGQTALRNGRLTEFAGRYSGQSAAEARIPAHIAGVLDLSVSDRLLEIGCGAGNLLLPLSERVASASGVDHPNLLRLLKERDLDGRVDPIEGDFLTLSLQQKFDKVLIYSVLHCLSDMTDVYGFVEKALDVVQPGGRVLLGDLPNADQKRRFLESTSGRAFEAEWRRVRAAEAEGDSDAFRYLQGSLSQAGSLSFTDSDLLGLVQWTRGRGANVYWLPQPPDLPFGLSREDILIKVPD